MFIKQVIIEGFKSYKDQLAVDPFSEKINVVVGANGSGKSNFFHAIRFVLNVLDDSSGALRQEERQRLLHEGAGHAVMSAYVELVFDNADGRLPVDRDEVRLRRSIGLKKDEYYLDKKHMTKTEVMNLLETAGFSRSNPYYVVQQGRIVEMAHMTDAKRLDLLKDIGGTKVYEERRRDSLEVLRECEGKRRSIQDLVEQLESRLASLDEERDELAAYQAADREKRAIEYTILDREISSTKEALSKLEDSRQKASDEMNQVTDEKFDLLAEVKAAEKKLKRLKSEREEASAIMKQTLKEKEAALVKKTKLELEVKELEERVSSGSGAQSAAAEELVAIEREISAKEKELESAVANLTDASEKETRLSADLAQKSSRLQSLFALTGGDGQYKSSEERDVALKNEISRLEEAKKTKVQSKAMALQHIEKSQGEIGRVQELIAEAETSLRTLQDENKDSKSRVLTVTSDRDELLNKQKDLWRREDELKRQFDQQREDLRKWDKVMESAAPREVTRGLNSVKRLVRQHNIEGVYGTLMELFSCPSALNTAVETVAGNALFHLVVETDEVATRLTELLIQERSGRATFIPLNRLAAETIEYPTEWGKDVMPLMKRMTFDDKFAPAISQVFGKVVVCRSLQLATEVTAATDRVNCVTMDGDQVERRGALRGGFVDSRKSRLEAMREYKMLTTKVGKTELEIKSIQDKVAEVSQDITNATSELSQLKAKVEHLQTQQEPLRAQIRHHQERIEVLTTEMSSKQRSIFEMEAGITAVDADISSRTQLIGTPLRNTLTPQEMEEMSRLQEEIHTLKLQSADMRASRLDAQAAVDSIEVMLNSNLRKRAKDLNEKVSSSTANPDSYTLSSKKAELEMVLQDLSTIQKTEKEAEGILDETSKEIRTVESSKDKMLEKSVVDERTAEDRQKQLESLNNRKSVLLTKRAELERRVRDLGTLPADAYEMHRDATTEQLHSALHAANQEAKKFAHVNQKALDQYVSFSEQREELARRKQENDAAEEKIRHLIETLDMRKDEAIERTFKQVALNFRQVFAALVPGGKGELVMQKAVQTMDDEAEEGGSSMDRYSGVKVKVSFGTGDVMSMKQLSGGQKTLVALTLIFSIQRCDPAPFYLFDEIDAALDPQYRSTVAHMLQQQVNDDQNPAQFIITTFHPQIVQVADKVYGASHRNRISSIVQVQREDALEFLQAEEKRGTAAEDARKKQHHEGQENIPMDVDIQQQ
ncbi:Structural maintenance of chromosomes protein 3 [Picochlorum sp. SENEW3]|nr:Structural maintenance of chromosomes protein 3 [Picochlorum sp. SENEW3]WPT18437.1 Structural maintenance of chromosomes protein 3 [Picochlorum sp. SENEW3]